MYTYGIHQSIATAMQYNCFTTEQDIERVLRLGKQAQEADKFLRFVANKSCGYITRAALEFISQHVGRFDDCVSENGNLRFQSYLADSSVDGYEFRLNTITGKTAKIYELVGILGVTTEKEIAEVKDESFC